MKYKPKNKMFEYTPNDDILVSDGYRQYIMDSVYKNEIEELELLSSMYQQCILYYSIRYGKEDVFSKFYNDESHHYSFLSLAIDYKNEYAIDIILKCSVNDKKYSKNYIQEQIYCMPYHNREIMKILIDYIVNVLNSRLDINVYGYPLDTFVYAIQDRILFANCLNEITQRYVYKYLCSLIEYELSGTPGPSIFSFLYSHNTRYTIHNTQ